jgi:UDP-N-acetylglucosamine 2-epimerase (hydrolysing)
VYGGACGFTFPSIRFEHFLTILRNADMIIGNSSAGIREAPYFGIPTINIGTRQTGRSQNTKIINVNPIKEDILFCLRNTDKHNFSFYHNEFGFNPVEPSYSRFIQVLNHKNFWQTSVQKTFTDKMKSE